MKKEWSFETIVIVFLAVALVAAARQKTQRTVAVVRPSPYTPPPSYTPPEKKAPEAPPAAPAVVDITPWPAVRHVGSDGIGKVLADIEGHMPAGHHYKFANNKITWAHETTHGINNNIRNKFADFGRNKVNAFYVLEDRGIVVNEPPTTIAAVDRGVPPSFRGTCHDLYLIRQRKDWNAQPLYLCDEWVAYTNGAACRKDIGMKEQASEMEFTMEFTGYVLCLAYTVKKECPGYQDRQFRAFVMWNIERSMHIHAGEEGANKRLQAIREAQDAEAIRSFARPYFGEEWCKRVLGF